MGVLQRVLSAGLIPLIALLALQLFSPGTLSGLVVPTALARSETPLIISAITHWSHFEKIAKVAVILAQLGYPITLITGRILQKEASSLHPNITYYPQLGQPDKLSEEDYKTFASFPPGSEEAQVSIQKAVLVDGMPNMHETLQNVFKGFRDRFGNSKPLISFYDLPILGHLPILLGAPGIKPDVTFAISCHPLSINSNDTYPFHINKLPETGPDAKAIHRKAYQDLHQDYRTREMDLYMWAKFRELGVVQDNLPSMHQAMGGSPDHLMTMGVPDFEFPRSDLRKNAHYFGALRDSKQSDKKPELPAWWVEVEEAKSKGRKVVAISQGTLETQWDDLLFPTLEALKDRDDILVIVSTVVVEPEDVPGLNLPANARAAKFVPYSLLLPFVDVLVNNGGYGAVMTALDLGIPVVVAGDGQDKVITNNVVHVTGVGINLGNRTPGVEKIREGVSKVLEDVGYKWRVVEMSKKFKKYDVGSVFDAVIQRVVGEWALGKGKGV
ncbi:glycosyltransferase family 1 protein [Cucurbitaria berberidis CBS 394.84]|uniref:Glycosyltransferase family 1 protein n=1 Tax=Cucurbitaria berberidis CBS 394.84 TaxID=1168544 RepID=A0A9P4LB57_9PLEO|nr:glycosyltransferase family 1 protein [Cucurbitaria berberidis CBS 394.84]KAF1848168.1 glycosyltransferase family 1 protein [Cucurbitaria berberidis CBS 394.84]